MYKEGDHLPVGMVVGDTDSGKWNVPKMWDKMNGELDIPKMRADVKDFNMKHKWIKRGLAFVPTKFGIAFTSKFMVGAASPKSSADHFVLSCRIKEAL